MVTSITYQGHNSRPIQPPCSSKGNFSKIYKKYKDTKDLAPPSASPIKRTYSLPQLSLLDSEKKACEAVSGTLWKCKNRKPAPFAGYIYCFEIKKEYDTFVPYPASITAHENTQKALSKLFPALEPSAYASLHYNSRFDIEALHQLGYRFPCEKNKLLLLPDREALTSAWQDLQKKHPQKNLPDLSIYSSNGVADDISFAEAYLVHNAVLSNGQEFVHDHIFHVIFQLSHMLRGKDLYNQRKHQCNKKILSLYQLLYVISHSVFIELATKDHAALRKDQLFFLLGAITDLIFAEGPPDMFPGEDSDNNWADSSIHQSISDILTHHSFKNYLEEKRNTKMSDINILNYTTEMDDLIKMFKLERILDTRKINIKDIFKLNINPLDRRSEILQSYFKDIARMINDGHSIQSILKEKNIQDHLDTVSQLISLQNPTENGSETTALG